MENMWNDVDRTCRCFTGAAVGRLVFTADEAEAWHQKGGSHMIQYGRHSHGLHDHGVVQLRRLAQYLWHV